MGCCFLILLQSRAWFVYCSSLYVDLLFLYVSIPSVGERGIPDNCSERGYCLKLNCVMAPHARLLNNSKLERWARTVYNWNWVGFDLPYARLRSAKSMKIARVYGFGLSAWPTPQWPQKFLAFPLSAHRIFFIFRAQKYAPLITPHYATGERVRVWWKGQHSTYPTIWLFSVCAANAFVAKIWANILFPCREHNKSAAVAHSCWKSNFISVCAERACGIAREVNVPYFSFHNSRRASSSDS